jgi:hypothetical protein
LNQLMSMHPLLPPLDHHDGRPAHSKLIGQLRLLHLLGLAPVANAPPKGQVELLLGGPHRANPTRRHAQCVGDSDMSLYRTSYWSIGSGLGGIVRLTPDER